MKTAGLILCLALSAAAAVMIGAEARKAALYSARDFAATRNQPRPPALARQLDPQRAAVDASFSRIATLAVARASRRRRKHDGVVFERDAVGRRASTRHTMGMR